MAVDYFLKIDGIEGESQDHKHAKEIQVISWSWGATQTGTMSAGGGGGAGKVNFQDLVFVHHVDKASPKLALACWGGDHIKKATLVARKAGKEQQEFMTVTLEDLLVSSIANSGATEVPTETVSLNFTIANLEYKQQKQDGTLDAAVKVGWDLKKNQKV